MSVEQIHNNNQESEVALRERMASIEAKQVFHQETLKDVSESLHEVVKTQHILANQAKEITKVVDALSVQHDDISNLKKDADMAKLRAEFLEDKVKTHQELLDTIQNNDIPLLRKDAQDNKRFTKNATKIIIGVVVLVFVPLTLAYIKNTIGLQ